MDLTDRDYRALARFRTSLRRFLRFSEEAARRAGLTPAQHQLLLAVRGFAGYGSPSVSDLADALQLRHHSVVELVDRAEAAGLVSRRADPADARRHLVTVTPAGASTLSLLTIENRRELMGSVLGSVAGVFMPPAPFAEPSPRWVRVRAGDTEIANSRQAMLLVQYGPDRLPTYCFPPEDVKTEFISADGTVRAGDVVVPGGAWVLSEPAEVAGYWTFAWDTGLTWIEEAMEIHVHAKDTHKRVDAVPSSRHVVVELDGVVVADTHQPLAVFETGLPERWYLPPEDVRSDLFVASDTVTRCPYKGSAAYWTAKVGDAVHEDVAWYYSEPVPEQPAIKGRIAFFNERVDLIIDGERLERPQTPWTRSPTGLRSRPPR